VKKSLFLALILSVVLASPVFAILTLPENAVASVLVYTEDLFDAIGAFIWLAIGIPLGFYVIHRIFRIMPSSKKTKVNDDYFEKEEREYQKVERMIEKKDRKELEKWIEKFGKGEI